MNQIVPVFTYVIKHSAVHYYKPAILGSVKEMVYMGGISIITLHLKINKRLCFLYIDLKYGLGSISWFKMNMVPQS